MFPNTGRRLPNRAGQLSEADYTRAVQDALRRDLGTSGNAAKLIQGWTGASNRTARNWLNGSAAPSGYHLVLLARGSDAVLSAVLTLTERSELTLSADLHAVEVALAKASGAFEVLRRQRTGRA
jgi:hypothetical protein